MKNAADAIRIFTVNVEQYPGKANVYDSLAEAYMVAKVGVMMRLKTYRKSLEIDPKNENAVEHIRELETGNSQ